MKTSFLRSSAISISALCFTCLIQPAAWGSVGKSCEGFFRSSESVAADGASVSGADLALPFKIDANIAAYQTGMRSRGTDRQELALRTGIEFRFDNSSNDEPVFLRSVPGNQTLVLHHLDLITEIQDLIRTNRLAAKMQSWGVSRIVFNIFAGRTSRDYGMADLLIVRSNDSETTIILHDDTRTGIPAGIMLKSEQVGDQRFGSSTVWRSKPLGNEPALFAGQPGGLFSPLSRAFAAKRFLALTAFRVADIFAVPEGAKFDETALDEILMEDLGFVAEPFGGLLALREGHAAIRTNGNMVRNGDLWRSTLSAQEMQMAIAAYRDLATSPQQKKARELLIRAFDLLKERNEFLVPVGIGYYSYDTQKTDARYSGQTISAETQKRLTGPIHWSQRGASNRTYAGTWNAAGLAKAYDGPRDDFFGLSLSPVSKQLIEHLEANGYQPDIKTGTWNKVERLQ